jgi:regulator of sigma D
MDPEDKERWDATSIILDEWLQKRQALKQQLAAGALDDPGSSDDSRREEARAVCERLVDYTSSGHFEVYGLLLQEAQAINAPATEQEMRRLLTLVDEITEKLLDFNDRYLEGGSVKNLARDLAKLDRSLQSRFDAEDQMLSALQAARLALAPR